MVRLGHPARMPKQEVRNLCLDALLDERDVTLGDFRNFMADFKASLFILLRYALMGCDRISSQLDPFLM